MEEKINKIDSSLLEIQIIREYLKQFKNHKIVLEDIGNDTSEIRIICGNELIKILFLDINNGKWWSIYRYHSNGVVYEQIEIITFSEMKENKYNRVIKYAGHIEDDNYSYIMCSGYSYLDQQIVNSWKRTRTVPIEDLKLIQYSDDMNLTELILMTDQMSHNILEKTYTQPKSLVLKLDRIKMKYNNNKQ